MAATETMAPLILGSIWSITALAMLFCALRLYIKLKYRGNLWYDDYTLAASMILLLLTASLVQRTVAMGYGRHVEEIAATRPQSIRGIITYLQVLSGVVRLSTNLARVSFAITLLRLSSECEKKFVWFGITTLLAVTIPAIILPFASCIPYEKIFDKSIPGTCIDSSVSVGYFIFEGAYVSLIDFLLAIVPWVILSRLQIRRVEKLGASIAMSLGVLSGVVTIIKAIYTNQITDDDFTYSSAELTIWNTVEPASVIIAASIPNLRVFIARSTASIKATFRLGSRDRHVTPKRPRNTGTDDSYTDDATMLKAISAGTDTRRGEVTAWITSRARGDSDGDSEKSILDAPTAVPPCGIMQTNTLVVEYPEDVPAREGR
ncbi:hypothetical protein F4808DRAFT_443400 [Astrocystis sublimbata]|nr:hypothetical protein F4808DRAFT_443400 [Astrocystis sublimbata]